MNARADQDDIYAAVDGLALEVAVEPEALAVDAGIEHVISLAILAANETAGPANGTVAVLVTNDDRLQALNRLWRSIDKPTNVLSFSYPDTQPGIPRQIGDIAISYETAAREAAAEGKPFAHHVAHLSVHGFLHLLGYDHESDEDADTMERLERTILARVDVPDPYIARGAKG